ncbi:MAG TPA: 3'-5' exonuclease [Anaerolineae bacterium]|nr:3'-5' exonuclease [Anaerolineae bacterium]
MIDKDWRRAIAQIKQLAERDNWVVVDTETTELYQPEIVQIAIVSAGGEILLNSLVKPKTPISAAASEVHGLTMELLHNAPTWGEVGARVDELIGDRLVVAYNAEFDNKALATTNKLHNREGVGGDWLCMMELVAMVAGDYSRYHKGYTWLSLSEACSIWDVEMTRAHDAAGDALAVVDLVRQVAGQ